MDRDEIVDVVAKRNGRKRVRVRSEVAIDRDCDPEATREGEGESGGEDESVGDFWVATVVAKRMIPKRRRNKLKWMSQERMVVTNMIEKSMPTQRKVEMRMILK